MAKYKVKDTVIVHMLKGNKMAKGGEVFDESQLINKEESLKGGFIELVKDVTKKSPAKKTK